MPPRCVPTRLERAAKAKTFPSSNRSLSQDAMEEQMRQGSLLLSMIAALVSGAPSGGPAFAQDVFYPTEPPLADSGWTVRYNELLLGRRRRRRLRRPSRPLAGYDGGHCDSGSLLLSGIAALARRIVAEAGRPCQNVFDPTEPPRPIPAGRSSTSTAGRDCRALIISTGSSAARPTSGSRLSIREPSRSRWRSPRAARLTTP